MCWIKEKIFFSYTGNKKDWLEIVEKIRTIIDVPLKLKDEKIMFESCAEDEQIGGFEKNKNQFFIFNLNQGVINAAISAGYEKVK